MGCNAIYPADATEVHRAFTARRRSLRPSEEYRTVFVGVDPVILPRSALRAPELLSPERALRWQAGFDPWSAGDEPVMARTAAADRSASVSSP